MPASHASIRRKLTRITMLAAFAALASASGSFAVYDLVTFRTNLVRRLSTVAEVVGSNSVSALLFQDAKAAEGTLAALSAEPNVVEAGIYGADGRLFATYRRPGVRGTGLGIQLEAGAARSHRFERDHVVILEPIAFQGSRVGTVLINSDLEEIGQRMRRYGGIMLLVSVASFLVALAISSRLQRAISRPLLHLVETARRVSQEKDYSVRAEPHGSDEIGLLISTFNEMLAQIQQRDQEVNKVAQENARLYRDAELASRMKDEFLATLSHELRTPLNAIVGWTQLLRGGQLDDDGRRRAIEIIDRNATAQSHLIQDILDVSRIISGRIHLELRPVDLGTIIQAVLDSLRPAAAAKRIQLEWRARRDIDLVLGDPDRMQQVVWNLVSNAIKFTPAEGRVTVALTHLGPAVEIAVTDTGVGIDSEFLPHVFERFRQADASTTRAHGGLGLGLAIVRHLVELHGGTVSVTSEGPGKGATFRVLLPVRYPAVAALEEALEEALDGRRQQPALEAAEVGGPRLDNLHVLVVEDQDDSRELMATLLRRYGAQVTAVASGREALEAMDQARPDVLVSDIAMPEMDGYALIRIVRERTPERGGRIPAAAISAYARQADRESALRAGFDLHLSKPLQPIELAAVVQGLAQRRGEKRGGARPPALPPARPV